MLESSTFNGIDFVEVANDAQTPLRVHFLNDVHLAHTLDTPAVTITGGESIPTVAVNPVNDATDWGQDDGTWCSASPWPPPATSPITP